jgi:predicted DNA-binding transcriptional regulator AlpA
VNTQNTAILRTKDIATALNVSKPTACRLLHSGKIPKIQISQKCIGAFQSDVQQYLKNQRAPAQTPSPRRDDVGFYPIAGRNTMQKIPQNQNS